MRRLLTAALPLLFVAVAFSQPHIVTREFDASIVGSASAGDKLAIALANGSVIVYGMPDLTQISKVNLKFDDQPIGIGFRGGALLTLAFSNGTIVEIDLASGGIARAEHVKLSEKAYKAVIKDRWVVFVSRYDYSTGKGSVKLDRLTIYDLKINSVTFVMDRKSGMLVYVFDIKIYNDLMLLTWIDTTCEICQLDDTFITIYNLTSYERIYVERFGECAADIDGKAVIAARVKDGKGIYLDLRSMRSYDFEVGIRPLGARLINGTGYVLARDPSTGKVSLFRVQGPSVHKTTDVPGGERGYSLFFVGGSVAVAAPSFILFDGRSYPTAPYPIPWLPSLIGEGRKWAAFRYGNYLLAVVSAVESTLNVTVTVRTEPYSTIHIEEVGTTLEVGATGAVSLSLPPGSYTIRVSKDGVGSNYTKIDVAPGTANLELEVKLVRSDSGNQANEIPSEHGTSFQPNQSLNGVNVVKKNETTSNLPIDLAPEQPASSVNVTELREKLIKLTQLQRQTPLTIMRLPAMVDLEGNRVNLSEGVKLLVFFYTKCTGCSVLVPKLKDLDVKVVMIAPTYYDDESSLKIYSNGVNASGWSWVLDRGGQLVSAFNVSAYPTVVLISDGRVEFIGVGAEGEALELAQRLWSSAQSILRVVGDPAVIAVLAGLALLGVAARVPERAREREI